MIKFAARTGSGLVFVSLGISVMGGLVLVNPSASDFDSGSPSQERQRPDRPVDAAKQRERAQTRTRGDLSEFDEWKARSMKGVPSGELWWVIDSFKNHTLRPIAPRRAQIEVMAADGSPMLSAHGATAGPGFGRLHTAGGSEVLLTVGDEAVFDPKTHGPIAAIEFQVDLRGQGRPLVEFALLKGDKLWLAPGPREGGGALSTSDWTRRSFKVDVKSLRQSSGSPEDPLSGEHPVRFGFKVTNAANILDIDNFEVRVNTACSDESKAKDQKALEERRRLEKSIAAAVANMPEVLSNKEFQDDKPSSEVGTTELGSSKGCCNDEAAEVRDGEIIAPEGTSPDATVDGVFVEQDMGPVDQLYPGYDTSTDEWLGQYPCEKSVGSWVPEEIDKAESTMELPELGIELPKAKDRSDLQDWEKQVGKLAEDEEEPDDNKRNIVPSPTAQPMWVPNPDRNKYAFSGYDIVFVHGLRLSHLQEGMINGDKRALTSWATPQGASAQDFINANPEYFGTGWHKRSAERYWLGDASYPPVQFANTGPNAVEFGLYSQRRSGHIWQFLLKPGYRNRFMIAAFNCNDRLDAAVDALLAQVGVAMATGDGVINPSQQHPGTQSFGKNGIVFVSHSAGSLVVNVALSRASNQNIYPSAKYIVNHSKAHVAAAACMGGSSLASGLMLQLGAGTEKAFGLLPYFGPLNLLLMTGAGQQFQNVPSDKENLYKPVKSTIIFDLMIPVAAAKYKRLIRQNPVPTVLVEGGHPTSGELVAAKTFLPGFDDFTNNANSQGALRNPWIFFWPAGSITPEPKKNFDLGLFGPVIPPKNLLPKIWVPFTFNPKKYLQVSWGASYAGAPVRAMIYYLDQRIDPFVCNPLWLQLNFSDGTNVYKWKDYFQASFVSPYLSPSGMLMEGLPLTFTPWSPYWRPDNHYTFLASAGDHFEGTHDTDGPFNTPDYEATGSPVSGDSWLSNYFQTSESNREETYVMRNKRIYQPYDQAVAPLPPAMKQIPVLRKGTVSNHEWIRGLYLLFTIADKSGNVYWSKRKWFYKRKYHLAANWPNLHQFDIVYDKLLK